MKTPRNAPCPCGSGKKYKHCHMAADEAAERTEQERLVAAQLKRVKLVERTDMVPDPSERGEDAATGSTGDTDDDHSPLDAMEQEREPFREQLDDSNRTADGEKAEVGTHDRATKVPGQRAGVRTGVSRNPKKQSTRPLRNPGRVTKAGHTGSLSH